MLSVSVQDAYWHSLTTAGTMQGGMPKVQLAAVCRHGLWCVSAQGTLAAWGCSGELFNAVCYVTFPSSHVCFGGGS